MSDDKGEDDLDEAAGFFDPETGTIVVDTGETVDTGDEDGS